MVSKLRTSQIAFVGPEEFPSPQAGNGLKDYDVQDALRELPCEFPSPQAGNGLKEEKIL